VRFREHRDAGDILELAARYRSAGADELVFYDISASPRARTLERAWVRAVARLLDIPFCVAGGIRSVADAAALLGEGAEKVSVNTPALEDPALIEALAARFGSQCVVVGIDSLQSAGGGHRTRSNAGDPRRAADGGRELLEWVREVQARGAGEIVLNCIERDGVRAGFDLPQLRAVRAECQVPLVASGGAGSVADFISVFRETGVDAALAASVFHTNAILIPELKRQLQAAGLPVRLERAAAPCPGARAGGTGSLARAS
jgi:imidazole glycerol-phosphate synthase subunit HisF